MSVDPALGLGRAALMRIMEVVQALGAGRDLDDILELIASAVVDVIGFDAVAVNIRAADGELVVTTVVGPPEVQELRGGTLSHDGWLELLDTGVVWGDLRFIRDADLDESIPHADPWPQRMTAPLVFESDADVEPWLPHYALLAPMWRSVGELQGVISVDLPRSGVTPDAEQRALLELFAAQAGVAVERVYAANVAADRTNLYRSAFSASPAPTAVIDQDLRITDVNPSFLELADAVDGELIGRPLIDLFAVDDIASLHADLAALRAGIGMVLAEEARLLHPRGLEWERWVQVEVRRVDAIVGGPRYVCLIADRTSVRASMSEMRHRAEHDQLTGLKLRAVGLDELQRRGARASLSALLFCDMDNFKSINDISGHVAGDRALVAVADCLRDEADLDDVVCRWGGDEFAVIADRPEVADVVQLADCLVDAVRTLASSAAPGDPLSRLGLSIGVAVFTEQQDPIVTIRAADAALYRSKAHPTQRVHVELL